jgi:hypothetical protein
MLTKKIDINNDPKFAHHRDMLKAFSNIAISRTYYYAFMLTCAKDPDVINRYIEYGRDTFEKEGVMVDFEKLDEICGRIYLSEQNAPGTTEKFVNTAMNMDPEILFGRD